ncbi:hypothetical protein AB3Y40_06525 [Yoonia sp. R2331]|uniref:hypothetical protein n=1 Tax=Yoonia sp. R2331 TaxID=3237238 RepID=UPI0034E3CE16
MIYAQADFFRVPLLSGAYAIGQVFEVKGTPDASVFCGLSNRTTDDVATVRPLVPVDIIAFCLVGDAHLRDQTWPLAGFDQIPNFDLFFDFEQHRARDFPDTPVHDPAVIEAFLNAWHGHYPWDAFGDLFNQIAANGVDRSRPGTP